MMTNDTNEGVEINAAALALRALAWVLGEEDRAQRLLALTGLTADHLRVALDQAATLAAVIKFLEAFEPDLIACADALGCLPIDLVSARRELEQ